MFLTHPNDRESWVLRLQKTLKASPTGTLCMTPTFSNSTANPF